MRLEAVQVSSLGVMRLLGPGGLRPGGVGDEVAESEVDVVGVITPVRPVRLGDEVPVIARPGGLHDLEVGRPAGVLAAGAVKVRVLHPRGRQEALGGEVRGKPPLPPPSAAGLAQATWRPRLAD